MALLYGAAISADQGVPDRMTIVIDKNGIVRDIEKDFVAMTHGADMVQKLRDLGLLK